MQAENSVDWLEAVFKHPDTDGTDLCVAFALIVNGSGNGITMPNPETGEKELLAQEVVDESISVMVTLGLLESIVWVGCDVCENCESHLLSMHIPEQVNH